MLQFKVPPLQSKKVSINYTPGNDVIYMPRCGSRPFLEETKPLNLNGNEWSP